MEQTRNDLGRFENKADAPRLVRSIRLTDQTWENFGKAADSQKITRADLIENIFRDRESLELLEAIQEREEKEKEQNRIEDKIKELISGLERKGKNELKVSTKEKAIARRVLSSLIDFLGASS